MRGKWFVKRMNSENNSKLIEVEDLALMTKVIAATAINKAKSENTCEVAEINMLDEIEDEVAEVNLFDANDCNVFFR